MPARLEGTARVDASRSSAPVRGLPASSSAACSDLVSWSREGARVRNSVIFADTIVERDARIDWTVVDSGCRIGADAAVGSPDAEATSDPDAIAGRHRLHVSATSEVNSAPALSRAPPSSPSARPGAAALVTGYPRCGRLRERELVRLPVRGRLPGRRPVPRRGSHQRTLRLVDLTGSRSVEPSWSTWTSAA